MSYHHKTILVDCDGVLTDWRSPFEEWMSRNGYPVVNDEYHYDKYYFHEQFGIDYETCGHMIGMFNQSAWIEHLPPLLDAVRYVRRLHEEHGFMFHVITSLNDCRHSAALRRRNLYKLFGESVFSEITCVTGNKESVLSRYKDSGCFWVEDKLSNAIRGERLGLRSIVMAHEYNFDSGDLIRLPDWSSIYKHMVYSEGYSHADIHF